jgi:predicted transposase YbfD/YdcC
MENKSTKHYDNQNLFTKSFSKLKDPRRTNKGNYLYPLEEVLFLVISSIISGWSKWTEIEEFGNEKIQWLRKYFPYNEGIPSHDVLGKIFSKISPKEFNECFMDWVNLISQISEGEVIAIDGKTIKGSSIKTKSQKALHIVSAYATSNRICLGQTTVHKKNNEITAIPELLELLAIKSCIITIDAMGCQKKIAKKIIDQEADYILMVKNNQSELLEQIEKKFSISSTEDANNNLDFGHGRIEERKCSVIYNLDFIDNTEEWEGLKSIVRVESIRYNKADEKEEKATRYYISSLNCSALKFNNAIRSHWAIENNLHWNLDVIFNEDKLQKKKDHSATNLNMITKVALTMIERFRTTKLSKNRVMLRASLNDSFRERILFKS